jgi:hypothetical protein
MKHVPQNQRGMVLLVSLLILLLMAIIATTVTQTNVMQLQMAGNDEAKTAAIQRALAVVDAVIDRANNTRLVGSLIGYTSCAPTSADPDVTCDDKTLSVNPLALPSKGDFDYQVTRMGPDFMSLGVARRSEDTTDTGLEYEGAIIEVAGSYDGTAEGLGAASVVQGIMIKVRTSPQ